MGLEPHALEKPACPFYGPSAMFGFTDPEDDRCALKTTNSGSDKCELKTNPDGPYQMKMIRDKQNWFGCPLNTVENRIKLARNLGEIERRELERELERQMKKYNIEVEILPPGIAIGAIETFVDNRYFAMKITSLGGDGRRRMIKN